MEKEIEVGKAFVPGGFSSMPPPNPLTDANKDLPVMVVIDADGLCIMAGKPRMFTKKEVFEFVNAGCTIKTVTLEEYRKLKWE